MKTEYIQIRLTTEEKEILQKQAADQQRSMAGQIIWLVLQEQKRIDKEKQA